MRILHVDSSILADGSVSRQVTAKIIERFKRIYPAAQLRYRNLAAEPLSHLTPPHLGALGGAPIEGALQSELRLSVELLEEFQASDVIVIGAPMYNFTIPSQLKVWIDRLVIAGRTFRYTATGAIEGLARGKRVIAVTSRGGFYGEGTPQAAFDFQEPYLRAVFGFIGITDVSFVRAEGVGMGDAQRQAALDAAIQQTTAL